MEIESMLSSNKKVSKHFLEYDKTVQRGQLNHLYIFFYFDL
jgi:hypothetical protein